MIRLGRIPKRDAKKVIDHETKHIEGRDFESDEEVADI